MLVSLHSWRGEGEGGAEEEDEERRRGKEGRKRRGDGKDKGGKKGGGKRRGGGEGASERERNRIDKFNGLGDRHAGDASQKALRTSFAEN